MNATVVKIGGSLAIKPEKLRVLCAKLSEVNKKHKLVIVPGGGEFADVVRNLDDRFSLSCAVSHRMAILGMDQYGMLLSDLIPNSVIVNSLEQTKKVSDSVKLPIFLPFKLFFNNDPLENSWDVTSDSIAVYVAGLLHMPKVLLVKDVDGVYTIDPKKYSEARLIEKLSTNELLALHERTSVDKFLPKLLETLNIDCFVVNGLFPERLEAILEGQRTICTVIAGNIS